MNNLFDEYTGSGVREDETRKTMKKSMLWGLIALVMMLAAVVPAMAADTSVQVSGGITQTLAISTDTTSVAFGQFVVGDNRVDKGNLTVTSAFVPKWQVSATMSDGYGHLRQTDSTYLANKLQQYDYVNSAWKDVQGLKFNGTTSTTMTQTYLQNVLVSDKQGTYGTTITYTITVV